MPFQVRIGDAEVAGLVDRVHRLEPPWHYPAVPAADWEPYAELLADGGFGLLNFRAFLIRADGKTLLIDAGWGPDHAPPGPVASPAAMLDEMAVLGVGPDDVDLVVFTHLHADHVGWNLTHGPEGPRPRFSRARYLVPGSDWRHFTSLPQVHPNITENALPLADLGVLDLLEDQRPVIPSLLPVATPGHTPGHTSYLVRSGDEQCLIAGDLVHHPIVADETSWLHRFDWDGPQAVRTREAVLGQLETDGSLAAFSHFPEPGFGRFERVDGHRRWRPLPIPETSR